MTDSQHSIQQVTDLFHFFHSELTAAFEKLGLKTSEETEAYLIHLLEGYVRLDPKSAREIGFHRPAAFMLGEALHAGGDRRIEAYRRLGDASLFSCGFFEDHLNRSRSLVQSDYYRSMGRNAYSSLHNLMAFKAPGGVFHQIFSELARKFDQVVEAFRFLAKGEELSSRARLLDRWTQGQTLSASDWAHLGLLPSKKGGDA